MGAPANKTAASTALSSDRIASLSDTMFGVAMTLVVTTLLPAIQTHKGSVLDLFADLSGQFETVVLSFVISARYWMSQQRRLAMTNSVTPLQTRLHLAFLFLIVLVPISTSLDGLTGAGAKLDPVMIYGAHLLLIALVNLLLWIEVHRTVVAHLQIVQSSLAVALFVAALAVGAIHPRFALYVWFSVLAAPLLARQLTPRFFGA
jgi:uncharacterized membrane protein